MARMHYYIGPPDIMRTYFGPESYDLHVREAKAMQIPFMVYRSKTIALDIDTVKDLIEFSRRESNTYTYDLLVRKEIMERLTSKR